MFFSRERGKIWRVDWIDLLEVERVFCYQGNLKSV